MSYTNRARLIKRTTLLFVRACLLSCLRCSLPPLGSTDIESSVAAYVQAERVIDGDTFVIQADASLMAPDGVPLTGEHVRLIGIDAPELSHEQECYAREALDALRARVENQWIGLEYSGDLRDITPKRRLLIYAHVYDHVLNEDMLENGFAMAYVRFPHRDLKKYEDLESFAKTTQKGLWQNCRTQEEKDK